MLDFILLSSASVFGFEIASAFTGRFLDTLSRVGIGIPFGIIVCGWIFFILTVYLPFSQVIGHAITFAMLLASAMIHFLRPKQKIFRRYTIFFVVTAIILPSIFLVYFLNISLLHRGKYVHGTVYGDLPMHLYIISSFTEGCNSNRSSIFDIESPFFLGERLAYPIMPNFISAILIRLYSVPIHTALFLPSAFFAVSFVIVLSSIVYRFTYGSEVACSIAPWLFFFLGGSGFALYFERKENRYADFVHFWGEEQYEGWFQNLIHIMLPQRASLFSLPIAYSVVLLSLYADFSNIDFKLFLFMGLLSASLPQVQPHSIIALFIFGASFILCNLRTRKILSQIAAAACFGLTVVVFGIPQMIPYLSRTSEGKNEFFVLRPIWRFQGQSPFRYWWNALGVFWVISFFHGSLKLNKEQLRWYFPAVSVFIVSNFVIYQPWHLDNTKVFNAAWIPLAIAVVSNYLSKINRTSFRGALIALCCLSGYIAVYRAFMFRHKIWQRDECPMEIAEWVRNNTDPKSIWIMGATHRNPVITLNGRRALVGPYNYVTTHGLNAIPRLEMTKRLMMNPDNTQEIDKFGVEYVAAMEGDMDVSMNFGENSTKWVLAAKFPKMAIWKKK